MKENEKVELKREYVAEIKKEVVAFANTDGGTIYIGIEDDGSVCGVNDADDVMLKVASSLRDTIAPDVMPYVSIGVKTMEEKQVVYIKVEPGANKPYYLKEKGLRPSGVYVRKGSSSQPVSDEGIRQMVIESGGQSFEERRSIDQNLTFDAMSSFFDSRGIAFDPSQMKTMKMIGDDLQYNNLALLLSDQCPVTIKVAVFDGKEKVTYRTRREFAGSLLKQVDDVYGFIDLQNKTSSTFKGLYRDDSRDYPEEAIREALLNSIVHRDYSCVGSVIINIFDDRMEFVSLGGLVNGIELESIFLGVSRTRNPNLASIFFRLNLVEAYGTGIEKILRSYRDEEKKPRFETAMGVFRVTLYNTHDSFQKSAVNYNELAEEETIMDMLQDCNYLTRKDVENRLGCGTTKAYKLLNSICDEGRLRKRGSGRNTYYEKV